MSTRRDPDQLLQAFLDEGPEVLPDRVLLAVQGDVHEMRQRAIFGPWRFSNMRTLLGAAAVLVIVVAGGGVLWATRGPSFGGEPTPTVRPSEPASVPAAAGVRLAPDQTYHQSEFGEPLSFVLPQGFGTDVMLDTWDEHTFRMRDPTSGVITIHDDVRLVNDICHPTGVIQDVPRSLEEIGAWLESSEGLAVTTPGEIGEPSGYLYTPDNAGLIRLGAVKYWDIELGSDCYADDAQPPGDPVVWFSAGERHRVYGITTDSQSDVIIAFTWGAGYGGEGDEVLDAMHPLTDLLVETFDFDGPTFSYD